MVKYYRSETCLCCGAELPEGEIDEVGYCQRCAAQDQFYEDTMRGGFFVRNYVSRHNALRGMKACTDPWVKAVETFLVIGLLIAMLGFGSAIVTLLLNKQVLSLILLCITLLLLICLWLVWRLLKPFFEKEKAQHNYWWRRGLWNPKRWFRL